MQIIKYISENWNRGLVMYSHGIETIGKEGKIFEEVIDDFMQFLLRGALHIRNQTFEIRDLLLKVGYRRKRL